MQLLPIVPLIAIAKFLLITIHECPGLHTPHHSAMAQSDDYQYAQAAIHQHSNTALSSHK